MKTAHTFQFCLTTPKWVSCDLDHSDEVHFQIHCQSQQQSSSSTEISRMCLEFKSYIYFRTANFSGLGKAHFWFKMVVTLYHFLQRSPSLDRLEVKCSTFHWWSVSCFCKNNIFEQGRKEAQWSNEEYTLLFCKQISRNQIQCHSLCTSFKNKTKQKQTKTIKQKNIGY